MGATIERLQITALKNARATQSANIPGDVDTDYDDTLSLQKTITDTIRNIKVTQNINTTT